MVSTDSQKYAEISKRFGAEVPYLREKKLSGDATSSWDVVKDVIKKYRALGRMFDSVCLLQPTSPLRTASDIRSAYDMFVEKKAFSVVSMTELEHPIAWCGKIGEGYSLKNFADSNTYMQRQKQEMYYRPNGAIYIVDIKQLEGDGFLYGEGSYAYIMSREKSVDIDTEFDFQFAEFLMRKNSDV